MRIRLRQPQWKQKSRKKTKLVLTVLVLACAWESPGCLEEMQSDLDCWDGAQTSTSPTGSQVIPVLLVASIRSSASQILACITITWDVIKTAVWVRAQPYHPRSWFCRSGWTQESAFWTSSQVMFTVALQRNTLWVVEGHQDQGKKEEALNTIKRINKRCCRDTRENKKPLYFTRWRS